MGTTHRDTEWLQFPMTETIYLSVDEKWLNGFDTCLPQNIMQQLNKEMVLKVLR